MPGVSIVTKETITIISPHQDDAALSLGNFIFCHKETSIIIINCYTMSEYSPFCGGLNREGVMKKRSKEDAVFGNHIQMDSNNFVNLDEPDGPIRLNTRNMDALLTERELTDIDLMHLYSLRQGMVGHLNGLLILPLGIGGHIDHNLACLAGLSLIKEYSSIAFYLDVPYWFRTSFEKIQERIRYVESLLGISLTPHIDQSTEKWDKKLLSRIYSSQITEKEVLQIVSAPFMGEIILTLSHSIANKLTLKAIGWTDLNL